MTLLSLTRKSRKIDHKKYTTQNRGFPFIGTWFAKTQGMQNANIFEPVSVILMLQDKSSDRLNYVRSLMFDRSKPKIDEHFWVCSMFEKMML